MHGLCQAAAPRCLGVRHSLLLSLNRGAAMHAVCSGCGCSHHSDAVVVAGLMMHCIVVLYLHVAPGCAQLVQLLHVNSGCCLSDRPVGLRLCTGAPEQHIEERLQSRFITRLVQVQRDGKAWRQENTCSTKHPVLRKLLHWMSTLGAPAVG